MLQGDADGCRLGLSEAERTFEAADDQERPDWLSYFDSAYLAAKFAHCFRELGDHKEAERYARRSLEMSDGYDRGRLFNTAMLSSILADQGRIDEAVANGGSALDMAENMQSARTSAYLADVGRRLASHRSYDGVGQLLDRMSVAGILQTS